MAVTSTTVSDWLGLGALADTELEIMDRLVAVSSQQVLAQVIVGAEEEPVVEEAVILYAARRWQSRQAPSGSVEQDGYGSQPFTSHKDLMDLIGTFRLYGFS